MAEGEDSGTAADAVETPPLSEAEPGLLPSSSREAEAGLLPRSSKESEPGLLPRSSREAEPGLQPSSSRESEPDLLSRSSKEAVEFQDPIGEEETEGLPVTEADLLSSREVVRFQSFVDLKEDVETPSLPEEEAEPPLRCNKEALEFLALIGPEDLQLCLFKDSLVTVSDSGREVGEFTVSVQHSHYAQEGKESEECYLVHASTQGAVDDAPCGASIIAYVSNKLETLEQHHHEYMKLDGKTLDKKTHLVKQEDKLVLNEVITQGEFLTKHSMSYDWDTLEGFVSEASNLLIMRILAKRREIPENMIFLAFDMESNLCTCTYNELGERVQTIGKETVEMFGIERTVWSEEDLPNTWQSFFLSDGHLSSRVQVGSPVTMQLLTMPILFEKDEPDPKPVFGKKDLNWEEDMQLFSQFLDRKEELQADHSTYIRRHPDVRLLLADFMQFLLLRKPRDIFTFAAEFFAPFATGTPPTDTFHTSYEPSPFRDPC